MTIQEMRELPNEELRSEIEKAREQVFRMRFQGKGKDLENPGHYKALRKNIARLKTILREREARRPALSRATRAVRRKAAHAAVRPAAGRENS